MCHSFDDITFPNVRKEPIESICSQNISAPKFYSVVVLLPFYSGPWLCYLFTVRTGSILSRLQPDPVRLDVLPSVAAVGAGLGAQQTLELPGTNLEKEFSGPNLEK